MYSPPFFQFSFFEKTFYSQKAKGRITLPSVSSPLLI